MDAIGDETVKPAVLFATALIAAGGMLVATVVALAGAVTSISTCAATPAPCVAAAATALFTASVT
jgi:hypothetical protein